MHNLKIVTSGDRNYFKFLWRIEQNIFKQFGEYPIIYDLGLTEEQKKSLKSEILKTPVPSTFSKYTDDGFIKAIHKPLCILDYFNRYGEDCIFIDADILFRRKINKDDFIFHDFDMGVTPRHSTEQYQLLYKNGLINSGFLYFKNNLKIKDFIGLWVDECKNKNISDQLGLSNLVSNNDETFFKLDHLESNGVKIKLIDPLKYNDVSLTKGLVLHYKNAGRSQNAYNRYKVEYFLIQYSLPFRNLYALILRVERKLKKLYR